MNFSPTEEQQAIFDLAKQILTEGTPQARLLEIERSDGPRFDPELWAKLGHDETLAYYAWPEYDSELVKENEIELAVQVLGKIKDKIVVSADADEEAIRQKALASEKVDAAIADREIKKVIVIKSRLVNIVVR